MARRLRFDGRAALLACALCSRGCSAGDPAATVASPRDMPPRPHLAFQLRRPSSPDDYPYDAEHPPVEGPLPGSTVYLSARASFDPEGRPIETFWNVRDPKGTYLAIDPGPAAVEASFAIDRIGPHTVALSVTERDRQHRTEQAQVTLIAAPHPCAADGVAAPCSDMDAVPGGAFVMGSRDEEGASNERPAHAATVAPFAMDRYEVSVGRFRQFVASYAGAPAAQSGAHPRIANSGWQASWDGALPATRDDFVFAIAECGGTYTAARADDEAHPVSCITWFEAFALCISENKRLPTEAEWEYAARGGDEQRTYPWGSDAPSRTTAVFACLFDADPFCAAVDLPVVGSLPRGAARWGHLDMAGSVWEWTLDAYAPFATSPCVDCAVLDVATDAPRVFRGGDFRFDDPSSLRGATRYAFDGAFPDQTRGFRCARSEQW